MLAAARAELQAENGSQMRIALADAERRFALPRDALEDLIAGVEMDVRGDTYETFDELVVYCRRVAGSIGRLCLAIFGASDMAAAAPLADDLGVAMQLTNILRDVREDLDRGRVYLPAEDRRRFGCEDLEAAPPDGFARLMAFEVQRAREWFDRGLGLLAPDRRAQRLVRVGDDRDLPPDPRADRPDARRRCSIRGSRSRRGRRPGWRSAAWRGVPVSRRTCRGGRRRARGNLRRARLRSAEVSVTLVEVRPRLGGAVYSFERDGLWLDNGQHVFLRCCDAYRALLDGSAAPADTVLQDRLAIPVLAPGRAAAWLRRSGLPAPLHLAGSLLRYRHLRPARADLRGAGGRGARSGRSRRTRAPTRLASATG